MVFGLPFGLREELVFGLVFGLVLALGFGLLQTRFVLITSRTPKEAHSRSLIAALTWLVLGLGYGLIIGLIFGMVFMLLYGLAFGLVFGLALAPSNGGGSCCCRGSLTAVSLALTTSLHPRTSFWSGVSSSRSFAESEAECAFGIT